MAEFPLKAYRLRRKISQGELGRELGVSSVTISRWESGARKIEKTLLPVVAEKTGIQPCDLRPDLAELLGRT